MSFGLDFDELIKFKKDSCNDNPEIFIIKDGSYVNFEVYIDEDNDIIIEIEDASCE